MWFEQVLRRISVGKRLAIASAALVLPMTILIAASVMVLQQQESELHGIIKASMETLLPLTILEYDLQRALTDELEAETGQSVSDYGGLTSSIDRLFSELLSQAPDPSIPSGAISSAQKAWDSARPGIERLAKRVTPLQIVGIGASAATTRAELTRAVNDIDSARTHLTKAIKLRTAAIATAQHRELQRLVWSWIATLTAAAYILSIMIYSIVKPTRELGEAIRRLSRGDLSVRVDSRSRDELGAVATYLNAMTYRFASRKKVLENEAFEDALTGLPNRRAILAALETALAAACQAKTTVSVLFIDVDRFKQVNDRFGHADGDQALIWLAKIMHNALRSEDILGRYAGDEFLAVLPKTPNEQAFRVAERLCASVITAGNADPRKPSVTVGVVTHTRGIDTAEKLIKAADHALYQGKRAGRGRVSIA